MERLIRMVAECTLTMSGIAAALLLLTPWLSRRYSARALRAAWLVVLVGYIVPLRPQVAPPAITVPVPQRVVYAPWRPPALVDSPVWLPAAEKANETARNEAASAAVPELANQAAPRFRWPEWTVAHWLCGLWILGTLAAFSLRVNQHRRFLRAVRRWGRPAGAPYQDALANMCNALGIRKRVPLYCCPIVDSPMLIGLLRPRVLLPEIPQSAEELNLILRHELIHLRRGDLWGRLLLIAATAAHWFNPLMGLIGHSFSLACEEACDATLTDGMSFDMRKYYSQTILRSMRRPMAVATALSTRYRGGKKMMKKRLSHILHPRGGKLGAAVVSLLLVAVLCGGMAFAFSGEDALDGRGRAEDLNERLSNVLSKIYYELQLLDPNIGSYVFSEEEFSREAYDEISTRLAYYENEYLTGAYDWENGGAEAREEALNAAWHLVRLLDLKMMPPTEEITALADSVLLDAGYLGLSHREYRVEWRNDTEGKPYRTWEVTASDGETIADTTVAVTLKTDGDGTVDRFYSHSPFVAGSYQWFGGSVRKGLLTEEERQALKTQAAAFYDRYAAYQGSTAENILVSDYRYGDQEGRANPYAFVWVQAPITIEYSRFLPQFSKRDDAGGAVGVRFQIEVDTGRVLSVSQPVQMSMFVNESYAETDWIALTGLSFPIVDDYMYLRAIGQEIASLYSSLNAKYGEALTDSEKLMVAHIVGSVLNGESYISGEGDWVLLREDLARCDSLEAFQAILHRDYPYFNQTPPGEPTRDEILAAATPTLSALGYSDTPLRSFMYNGPIGGSAGFHDIMAANMYSGKPIGSDAEKINVTAAFNANGKVRYLYGSRSQTIKRTDPIAESERQRIVDIVWRLATDFLDFPGTPIEGSVKVGDTVRQNIFGERLIDAYVLFEGGLDALTREETDEVSVYAVMITIDVVDERVALIWAYGSQENADQALIYDGL